MPDAELSSAKDWLAGATVDPDVFALRPDYAVVLMTADGLQGGPSDATSDAMLRDAEQRAAARLGDRAPDELPHVAQWRDAFRSFGAKPQRTRSSIEALLRRSQQGLPRIDRLTDIYNAISVSHVVPVGGEDRRAYAGSARLARARGDERFDVMSEGLPAVEYPEPGEVVWRDDVGVTCRRWNWRQCIRTRITDATQDAVFIIDGLSELGLAGLEAVADALQAALAQSSSGANIERRVIAGPAAAM